MTHDYDVIVIGSGMGALAFGSLMAKIRGTRVLVLERHFKIGGFTHTFARPGGWSWDVGLHYVGEMGDGMMGRRLFDFIRRRHVIAHVGGVPVEETLRRHQGRTVRTSSWLRP
jgi:phytoene dehydrogenase-like protein